MDLISIIIPIYNCEKYLEQCLNSVISQDYKNLEIILINDGSDDKSFQISENFRKKDNRIRLINQINQGQSAARNLGIKVANGKYVYFLDSDDWLSSNHTITEMHNVLLEKKANIVVAGYDLFHDKTKVFGYFNHSNKTYTYSPNEWFEKEYTPGYDICFTVPWGSLYKATLLKNIRFPVGKDGEDDMTTWKTYLKAKKICFKDSGLYMYRVDRDTSVTSTFKNAVTDNSIHTIAERITIEQLIGFENIANNVEMSGFLWRINKGKKEALENGIVSEYNHCMQLTNIINKYQK